MKEIHFPSGDHTADAASRIGSVSASAFFVATS